MNEEAIQDSYNVFVSQGYTKSIDEYKKLIATNSNALNDSYNAFKEQGYGKSIDEYKTLMGVGSVKKKDTTVSSTPTPPQKTTGLSSEDGSSDMVSQRVKDKQAILTKKVLDKYKKDNEKPFDSTAGKAFLGTAAFLAEPTKTVYDYADNIINTFKNSLRGEGFFDDDIPDTDTPISDAVKKAHSKSSFNPSEDMIGLIPTQKGIEKIGNIASKIINSVLPQETKNKIISGLTSGSERVRQKIKDIDYLQEYALPKDNLAVNVSKNILGMVPDLLAAEAIGSTAATEGKIAKTATQLSEEARPLLQKYLPKAAKFIEEAVTAPFTKVMATKAALASMANAKEDESVIGKGLEGALEGGLEGVYMHTLGAVAGKAMPVVSKGISKLTGAGSTLATAIANPLANAGVFTTAKALRKGIEEQKLITPEEAAMEAATGVGFSLLHAGSLYKNHNELNHYADNTLKTDEMGSLGRVLNETKDNLDLVYNPDLTEAEVKNLEEARDELKPVILKEPDLQNKQILINEALKIQNQLDAHSSIKNILENKDALIDEINSSDNLSDELKSFYTKKVESMADHFDNSEFGLKKKELDFKIDQAQKALANAAEKFTNSKKASERLKFDDETKQRRAELEGLNTELNNLIKNKDAVQEQTTDESVLRTKQPELELQGVGEGNAKPGEVTEEVITTTQPEEVVAIEEVTPTEAKPEKEQWKIDYERRTAKVDEFNAENRPSALDKVNSRERKSEKEKLEDELFKAKKNISRADDADLAIEEYNKKKKELEDFDNKTQNIENNQRINDLIYDEIEQREKDGDRYEYSEEFNKDPREASLKSQKDLVDFLEERGNENDLESIDRYKNDIKLLEQDIKDNPLKKNTVVAPTETPTPVAETPVAETPVSKEYDSDNKNHDTNMSVLSKVLDKSGIIPPAEPFILESDNSVSVTYKGQDYDSPETTITFNKNKNGAWSSKGYKVEKIGVETKTEPTPVAKPEPNTDTVEQRVSKIDTAIQVLFDRNGLKIEEWGVGPDNFDLISLKRAKKALQAGVKDFKIFSATRSGERFLEMERKFEAPAVEAKPTETKAEVAPVAKPKENKKLNEDIAFYEKDVDYYEFRIPDLEEEIKNEEINTKQEVADLNKKIAEVKADKSLSREQKKEAVEDLKYEIENTKENQQDTINDLKDDLKEAKAERKKSQKKLDALKEKRNALTETKSEIDELLDLDTKDKTSLQRVSDYLEKLDRSLDLDPNELNDVTRVIAISTAKAVIKTLKALVNAGVTLQEAIKMASAAHKVKEEQIIDALDIVSKINENKSEGISEMELPGYNKFSKVVDGAISNGKTIDNILSYMNRSEVYKNATDVQKELLVRDIRKRFGLKEKSAPSVGKLFGTIKDIAKITMTEKAALIKQIKDLARGGNDAQKAIREATQALIKEVGELREGGKINKPQEQAILNRLGKTNVLSETSVRRYIDYVSKVYTNAEYSGQLGKANDIKLDIKSLSKNKEKNASLKELGKEFANIDPSMVDDIYAYNDIASKIKTALNGSKIRGQKVNFADTVNIDEAIDFTNKAIESQTEKLREERIAELQDLLGVDASEFSAEEIDALLKGEKQFKDEDLDEKIVRATINKAFNLYSTVIKEVIRTGKDTFTDEPIEFTKTQKELVNKFIDMDLSLLEKKDALSTVDALQNFLVNKSTAKMDAVVKEYQGIKNIKELTGKGIKSRELTKYGSKMLGRQLADKVTSLPVMFEKMFPGLSRSGEVMDKIGLTELFHKRSATLTEGNNIVDDFVNKLYKKKANGEGYNTEYNITERALAAHAIRSLIGTEEQIQKEFEDRKSLIDQSITELSKGNDKEKKLAELYKKAYDKILKDSNNADEVLSKTDSNNKEGVDFWIDEFNKKYDRAADVSENIYNTKLDRDLNYTPMKFSKLSTDSKEVELDNDQSSFHSNNGSIIVPKTGSLNEIQRLSVLPKGKYVDLSFDKNMANSMYDLLTDINTAGYIRQIKAAINSPEFDKLVPYADDRALLKGGKNKMGRVELYVKLIRNKNPYSTSEDMKTLNRIAKIGVGQALAGLGQPFKQTIPVAVSTFINTKGKLQLGATFNPKKLSFIDNSGYSIANRGRQSQTEIESVNRLIEKAEGSFGSKAIKYIEKANELQLKYLLEKPDVYIAKASWITYYEEALKKQGINTRDLDYSKHEINEEAANYAQRQVDRQQNISDHDLAGRLYTDKNSYAQIFTKMLMPFSSFRMNASAKFGADMITLRDKTSSKEDRAIAIRSISGYAAEMAVFRLISIGSAVLIGSLANKYLGKDETDKEFDKRVDNTLKGGITGTFTDIFSPIPVLDPIFQQGGAKITEGIDELMDTNIAIYDVPKQEFLKEYGTLGISIDRLSKLWTLGNLAATGKYKDDFGKEKQISEQDREALIPLVPLSLATDIGLAPTEINTGINNAVKFSKKAKEGMNQEELKKLNPEMYERIYGEESANYRVKQYKKEREARIKERTKRD